MRRPASCAKRAKQPDDDPATGQLESEERGASFSEEEDDLIFKLHALLGSRWSLIAGRLPGRSEEEVKDHWNSNMRRKLVSLGVDPDNHRVNDHLLLLRRRRRRRTDDVACSVGSSTSLVHESTFIDLDEEKNDIEGRHGLPDLNLDLSSPPDQYRLS